MGGKEGQVLLFGAPEKPGSFLLSIFSLQPVTWAPVEDGLFPVSGLNQWDALWLWSCGLWPQPCPFSVSSLISSLFLPQCFSLRHPQAHFSCLPLFPAPLSLRVLFQELSPFVINHGRHYLLASDPGPSLFPQPGQCHFLCTILSQLHDPHLHFKVAVMDPNHTREKHT